MLDISNAYGKLPSSFALLLFLPCNALACAMQHTMPRDLARYSLNWPFGYTMLYYTILYCILAYRIVAYVVQSQAAKVVCYIATRAIR